MTSFLSGAVNDIDEIIHAANIHYPRNNIPVPSPGVGGACLSKDPHILIELSKKAGYYPKLIAEAIMQLKALNPDERLKMGKTGYEYALKNLNYTMLAKKLAKIL